MTILLRDDLHYATSFVAPLVRNYIQVYENKQFVKKLVKLLHQFTGEQIVVVNAQEQCQQFLNQVVDTERLIILDQWLYDESKQFKNIQKIYAPVSRTYDTPTSQYGNINTIRPEHSLITHSNIIDSVYDFIVDLDHDQSVVIVDDDSKTGRVFTPFVQQLTKWRIKPYQISTRVLTDYVSGIDSDISDVLDARDFLVGASHGGAVVKAPNHTIRYRAPYVSQCLDLTHRTIIPKEYQYHFSNAVLDLNISYYKGVNLNNICMSNIKFDYPFLMYIRTFFPLVEINDVSIEDILNQIRQLPPVR